MTTSSLRIDDALAAYLDSLEPEEPRVLVRLREATAQTEYPNMQIGWDQGRFMALLLRCIGARNTIEVGVFTGYSTLIAAMTLPDSGRIVACDINRDWTDIGQRYWQEAGVADKIDLRIGPAVQTLDALLADDQRDSYDFAFIDADKSEYDDYYERCLALVRSGGVIAIDNALWDGSVANPAKNDEDTQAIRVLNEKIAHDARVESYLAAVGDGVHLACKK